MKKQQKKTLFKYLNTKHKTKQEHTKSKLIKQDKKPSNNQKQKTTKLKQKQ